MSETSASSSQELPAVFEPVEVVFRAISLAGKRRGIRLEAEFWRTLHRLASERNVSVSELVAQIEKSDINPGNLTSAIRTYCLRSVISEHESVRDHLNDQLIRSLLFACPSPAISLLFDRRLHAFNQAFIRYVARSFSMSDIQEITSKLGLVLDQPIEQIERQLLSNGNKPVTVGMVIKLNDKELRGRMNTVLVPDGNKKVLFCHFLQ